jgi:hypothetical protein
MGSGFVFRYASLEFSQKCVVNVWDVADGNMMQMGIARKTGYSLKTENYPCW